MIYTVFGSGGILNLDLTDEHASRSPQPYIGFFPAENVPSYDCNECRLHFDEPPKIMVNIRDLATEPGHSVTVVYRCTHCDKYLNIQFLETAEGIDPSYIVYDETGDFKTPTSAGIEDYVAKARESAAEGEGTLELGSYYRFLRQAVRWASKIGYPIPEALPHDLAVTYRQNFLRKTAEELPETVRRINDMSYAFSLREDEMSGMTDFEGHGLAEIFGPFVDSLPLIELPDDPGLRRDIAQILNAYESMIDADIDALRNECTKLYNQLAEREKTLGRAHDFTTSYENRAGLPPEQV